MIAKKKQTDKKIEKREVPEYKIKIVADLADKMKKSRTVLIASTRGLPSSQFHEIKKNLRGKAIIRVAKKSAVLRAVDSIAKASFDKIKENIGADIALFFSELDPFTLSGLLADNKSAAKAKAGDIAPEDINVEPGPTNLVPGPAISELSGVGLKVAVEGGKLAIKLPHTIIYAGEVIKENVASVMAKLDIKPMKVGFEPIAAYDKEDDKVYVGIKIDKKKAHEELKEMIGSALGFAVSRGYMTKETASCFIAKAGREEIALSSLLDKKTSQPAENSTQAQTSQPSQTSPQETAVQPAASS
ncbi:50S ribosomal protein L10 [Candidatus Pacearchaeota archaeon]|nr:50S ribosomal protein L10 [Candidatus Pacearchaeota archaeon]